MNFAVKLSLYHLHTLDYVPTLDWLLSHPDRLAVLKAWDNLYGTGPDRDDLRAQSLTAMTLNHARTIAMEKIPAELQGNDLVYLKSKAPDPRVQEEESRQRARRR